MTIKKLFCAIAAASALFALSSCAEKHLVTADVEGLGDGNIIAHWYTPEMEVVSDSDMVIDTIKAQNGRFTFNADFDTRLTVFFIPEEMMKKDVDPEGNRLRSLSTQIGFELIKGETVKIKADISKNYWTYTVVEGSAFLREQAESHSAGLAELFKREKDARAEMIKAYYEFEDIPSDDFKQKYEDASANLKAVSAEIDRYKMTYIEENPASELSSMYLLSIPTDNFMTYYDMVSAPDSRFAEMVENRKSAVEEYLKKKKASEEIVPGAQAPDFMLTDNGGAQKSLRDFKSDYIVLDFWGSWCVWCIKGIPQMKEYYQKYNGRLEIIGIACKDSDKAWRKAIAEHDLPWPQLKNVDEGDMNVASKYGVMGYPTKIILDCDYKIVEVVVGESEDFYKTLDRLMK